MLALSNVHIPTSCPPPDKHPQVLEVGWGSEEALTVLSLFSVPCLFSEVARSRRRGFLGASGSAGLDAGIGFSVGDHIFNIQTELLLRVKEESVINYGRTKGIISTTIMNKPSQTSGFSSSVSVSQRPLVGGTRQSQAKDH